MAQEWSLTEASAAPRPQGKGAIITGALLLVIGLVLGIVGIVGVVTSAAGLISGIGSSDVTPTTFRPALEAGTTYAVYEDTVGGSGDFIGGSVTPDDVIVTAPDGSLVPVGGPGPATETVSNSSGTFVVVATFVAPTTGVYQVEVGTDGALVFVAPSLTSLSRAVGWVALIGLGVLAGVAGLITLIVGLVRRSSSRKAAAVQGYATPGYQGGQAYAPPGYLAGQANAAPPVPQPLTPPTLPPAGWYPDSERQGGQRYWDGAVWTEHRA